MSTINSPNMSLPIPVVGQEPGPDYAFDLNNSLTLVDSHDHSPGRGVQITPNGLNINSLLSLNNNTLGSIAGLNLQPQSVVPAINTIYENGVDLYYVDGLGNNIRVTQSGGIAGSPGSISNLTAPASASYVAGSQKFVWQSNANIAANMDFGSAIMRNLSPNSTFALTLQPPGSLASNYSITLPLIPASRSIMTLDNSGIIATPDVYPITTASIASGTIVEANIAPHTITTTSISNSANIIATQLSPTANILGTQLDPLAGILPSQIDSITSGNYINKSTSSGSFSTTTSGIAIPLTSVPTGSTGTRPYFITFINGSIGVDINNSAASNAGTVTADFRLQNSNGVTVVTVADYTMSIAAPVYGQNFSIPSSALNCIVDPTICVGTTFRLNVSVSVTGAGNIGTVTVTNVVMQITVV